MIAHEVYVPLLLSHTVLSELYQEKLVTEDEVKWMTGEGGNLHKTLVPIQCTKCQEMATKAADLLDNFGYREEARKLRGL